jgi:hypothetical protein
MTKWSLNRFSIDLANFSATHTPQCLQVLKLTKAEKEKSKKEKLRNTAPNLTCSLLLSGLRLNDAYFVPCFLDLF